MMATGVKLWMGLGRFIEISKDELDWSSLTKVAYIGAKRPSSLWRSEQNLEVFQQGLPTVEAS